MAAQQLTVHRGDIIELDVAAIGRKCDVAVIGSEIRDIQNFVAVTHQLPRFSLASAMRDYFAEFMRRVYQPVFCTRTTLVSE